MQENQHPQDKTLSQQSQKNLKQFIKQSTSIHRQRMQRVQQCNIILKRQYKNLHQNIVQTIKNKNLYDKQLDDFITSLGAIDRIQSDLYQTERNIDKIVQMISRIESKVKKYHIK